MLDHSIDSNEFNCKENFTTYLLVALESKPKITPQNLTNVQMLYLLNVFFQFLSVLVFVQCYYLRVDQPVNPE